MIRAVKQSKLSRLVDRALERLSRPGTRSLPLTREWRAALRGLRAITLR